MLCAAGSKPQALVLSPVERQTLEEDVAHTAFGLAALSPALTQGTDTPFTEQVGDVVVLDLDQPEKAQGLGVDENIPIRARGRTPGAPGPAAGHSVLAGRRDAPRPRPHV